MRSIWSDFIGFDLVNIPIKLHSATQDNTLDIAMDLMDEYSGPFVVDQNLAAKQPASKNGGKTDVGIIGIDTVAKPPAAIGRSAPLDGNHKYRFPESFSPMLATLTEPFSREGWLYEIKWDGYRALAMMDKKAINLLSRNKKSFNQKYPSVYAAVKDWGIHAIVDGEIVALNKAGKPEFNALQNWQSTDNTPIIYYVFDLLWLNGHDLTGLPLEQRRDLLRQCVPKDHDIIRFSENFDTSATKLLKVVNKMGLEGIIAKKAGSLYFPGERTREWAKIKTRQRQEVVIGGYIHLHDSAKPFSTLLVGVYEAGKFRCTGKIGTGFSQEAQRDLMRKFKPLIRETNPFEVLPKLSKPAQFRAHSKGGIVTFVEPKLICEVEYTAITPEGIMHHSSFAGLRDDKRAKEVVQEVTVPAEEIETSKPAPR